jgi:hypothetical protein
MRFRFFATRTCQQLAIKVQSDQWHAMRAQLGEERGKA